MNRLSLCAIVAIVLVASPALLPAAPTAATSRIETVTVYRGQAIVTRVVDLPNRVGEMEIVLDDLPAQVLGTSLHASAAAGVAIRSVQFRVQAVAQQPNKEIAQLDADIKSVTREVFALKQHQTLLKAKTAYAEKLENFAAPTAKVEMAQGVLNAETLGQVTTQILKLREDIITKTIELAAAEEDLQEKLALLQRKRSELTKGSNKTVRQAVIFLARDGGGAGTIRLSYLVGSANWSPTYNVRLNGQGTSVEVEYLAQVQQMSGEDWKGVKVSLSTATPQMNAKSPPLAPLWIDLIGQQTKGKSAFLDAAKNPSAYAQVQRANTMSQYGNAGTWAAAARDRGQAVGAGWELNRNAAEIQGLELNVDDDVIREFNKLRLGAIREVLAVSYALPGTMSLASRSDQQLVQIAKLDLPSETYYQAIPLLTSYIYRAADVTNTAETPLLAGPYSAYVGGEFVGQGNMLLVARGEKTMIGFGVDTQLRCRRELLDKSDSVSWGNRTQEFTYRLRLENFKDEPVTVRLIDRIPATKSEDVRITLARAKTPLSTDALYVRDLKDRGILRWDLDLKAGASGVKAMDVEYGFEMRFAKDKHVGQLIGNVTKAMQADFQEMMLKQ